MFRNFVAIAITTATIGITGISAQALPLQASGVQPQPDSRGNFHQVNWQSWRVVDRDPNGLNCRRGPGMNHQIVRRLSFLRPIAPASSNAVKLDKDRDPWVQVRLENNQTCFVRSHSAYILPTWDFYQQS